MSNRPPVRLLLGVFTVSLLLGGCGETDDGQQHPDGGSGSGGSAGGGTGGSAATDAGVRVREECVYYPGQSTMPDKPYAYRCPVQIFDPDCGPPSFVQACNCYFMECSFPP